MSTGAQRARWLIDAAQARAETCRRSVTWSCGPTLTSGCPKWPNTFSGSVGARSSTPSGRCCPPSTGRLPQLILPPNLNRSSISAPRRASSGSSNGAPSIPTRPSRPSPTRISPGSHPAARRVAPRWRRPPGGSRPTPW
ncbi:hypothetical protein G7085_11680 [Tessaracoccus sp. HDW20]|uniref:hypothetical protein n=1 Tax=Tessaracoccus coleopterorum TaxID=2714950 RepID=UPI0018D419EA|nr:hypothetical protein [Tessaracoccus coleopterorum]NHB85048.1 hypothetical protein [Tessaracoccus coleopterorum]